MNDNNNNKEKQRLQALILDAIQWMNRPKIN